MNRTQLAAVLDLHRRAYALLLWLDREASSDPRAFAGVVATTLRRAANCQAWIAANRDSLPQELLPEQRESEAFSRLLASFFETSFRVDVVTFGGEVVDARLARGVAESARANSPRLLMAHALRQLAAEEGVELDQTMALRLQGHKRLQNDIRVWSYCMELERRAKKRTKGAAAHKLWRAINPEVRRKLTVDVAWEARTRLVTAILEASG